LASRQEEGKIIKRAVMDVISKFFTLSTENSNSRGRNNKNRIMNMALTTDMIADAHATLNEIKELIAKI
jgi:hypothetical protein